MPPGLDLLNGDAGIGLGLMEPPGMKGPKSRGLLSLILIQD
jgi:hypothetical protein